MGFYYLEDEIDYSDDDVQISTEAQPAAEPAKAASAPAADTKAATTTETANGDAAAPTATTTEGATRESTTKDDGATAAEETTKETFTPSLNLPATDAEKEAEKRAARAKRFGIEEDDETLRRAERAKRFGIDAKSLATGLDAALPERHRKRGRAPNDDGEGGGKRQSMERSDFQNNRRGGGRGRGRGGRGGRFQGGRRGGGGGGGSGNRDGGGSTLVDPVEKAKAEKRAQRFAA
jgi:SAP domain-containing ribonucleoprotein